jgi:hypothetical protein
MYGHVRALDEGQDVAAVRAAADAIVRRIVTELRERAARA